MFCSPSSIDMSYRKEKNRNDKYDNDDGENNNKKDIFQPYNFTKTNGNNCDKNVVKNNDKYIDKNDLNGFGKADDSINNEKEDFDVETRFGSFRLRAYQQTTNKQIHIALTKGTWNLGESILTRINSSQVNNDLLGTLTNNADQQLDDMFQVINEEGKGAVIFINQDMQSVNLLNRIAELKILQSEGVMKAPKIIIDSKDFGIGAQILHDIDISKIRLVSNTEGTKRVGMIGYGLEITEHVKY